jgi:hypothetical protein
LVHTSKYIDTGFGGIVNLCLANKLPSAGEALDLSPLLLRTDGVKTNTDHHERTMSRWYGCECMTQQLPAQEQ